MRKIFPILLLMIPLVVVAMPHERDLRLFAEILQGIEQELPTRRERLPDMPLISLEDISFYKEALIGLGKKVREICACYSKEDLNWATTHGLIYPFASLEQSQEGIYEWYLIIFTGDLSRFDHQDFRNIEDVRRDHFMRFLILNTLLKEREKEYTDQEIVDAREMYKRYAQERIFAEISVIAKNASSDLLQKELLPLFIVRNTAYECLEWERSLSGNVELFLQGVEGDSTYSSYSLECLVGELRDAFEEYLEKILKLSSM